MDASIDLPTLLTEPIGLFMAAVVLGMLLAGVYRLSGTRSRRLKERRAKLKRQAAQTDSLRERRELMLQWSELGGLKEHARRQAKDTAKEDGRKARAAGRPLSANPFPHALWGAGRAWKAGWRSVDRNIRWIEGRRQTRAEE